MRRVICFLSSYAKNIGRRGNRRLSEKIRISAGSRHESLNNNKELILLQTASFSRQLLHFFHFAELGFVCAH